MPHHPPCISSGRSNFNPFTRLLVAAFATVSAVAAQTQVITMGALAAKTYGDAPFTVTASANSGLPITKWESSDPNVAKISPSGVVTIVGAGQTSIIASSTGNSTFTAGWVARPLNVALSSTALSDRTRTVTYDGIAKEIDLSVLPSGQATEISYRDSTLPVTGATPQVVFQNVPDTLNLSYFSTGFQATQTWGLAKYIKLAGTARKLTSCDTTIVTWSKYADYLSWANANPNLVVTPTPGISIPGNSGGFYHPITLSFYDFQSDATGESYRLLTSQTVQAFIPWRPLNLVNGVTPYSFNGYAFRVPFNFPDGVLLPDNVWVAVNFSASTVGTLPIGSPGPYDGLNIPQTPETQLVGATLFPKSLIFKDWRWQQADGNTGPQLRIRTVASNETDSAPVNAGTYEVKTQATRLGADSRSAFKMVVNKAPLKVNLTNLAQVRDGTPKPVSISTVPANIATRLTYGESLNAPTAKGFYPVVATSTNPNYEGQSSATLRIGETFATWQSATFGDSGLPLEQTTDNSDPDGDGLSNFLEYASNSNPLVAEPILYSEFAANSEAVSFTYRRNMEALDLSYTVLSSTKLMDSSSWEQVTPLGETTISDDGVTRVIKASMSKPIDETSFFMRLKISR